MSYSSDPRATRSRRMLIDAAIELFLINPGASMQDVAKSAGVGRATLYRQFKTREDLILELAIESLEITNQVLQPVRDANLSARDSLEQGITAVMQVANRYHFILMLWNIAGDDQRLSKIYDQQLEELSNLIDTAKQEGSIDTSLSTSWIVHLIDSLVYAGWWSVYSKELTANQAGEHAAKTLFAGISPTR